MTNNDGVVNWAQFCRIFTSILTCFISQSGRVPASAADADMLRRIYRRASETV